MTASEFGTWAVGYYGPWPAGMKTDIRDYLMEKSPDYLDMLKVVCKETVPTRIGQVNGYPPDVAKMQELAEEVGRRLDAEARHTREIAYAAKALPSPEEPTTYADLRNLDWAEVFAHGIAARKQALAKGRLK